MVFPGVAAEKARLSIGIQFGRIADFYRSSGDTCTARTGGFRRSKLAAEVAKNRSGE
jgi:hypothetical protein